jgi:hypothetical protein
MAWPIAAGPAGTCKSDALADTSIFYQRGSAETMGQFRHDRSRRPRLLPAREDVPIVRRDHQASSPVHPM